MEARGRAGTVGQRSGKNFDSFGREHSADLTNAGRVGAVAVADEKSLRIEPNDVSGFGAGGRRDHAECGDLQGSTKRGMVRALGYAIGLARAHNDQTVVGGK